MIKWDNWCAFFALASSAFRWDFTGICAFLVNMYAGWSELWVYMSAQLNMKLFVCMDDFTKFGLDARIIRSLSNLIPSLEY